MTTKERLSSVAGRYPHSFRTAGMLTRVQDEIGWEEVRSVRQTTLERWFVGHAPKEVTTCDNS
jgi:hypothetical protein